MLKVGPLNAMIEIAVLSKAMILIIVLSQALIAVLSKAMILIIVLSKTLIAVISKL